MESIDYQIANKAEEDIIRKLSVAMSIPDFPLGSVPVKVAANVLGKGEPFIRWGIENGVLPIGAAQREEGNKRCNLYISPKLLWEYTGYVWKGEQE